MTQLATSWFRHFFSHLPTRWPFSRDLRRQRRLAGSAGGPGAGRTGTLCDGAGWGRDTDRERIAAPRFAPTGDTRSRRQPEPSRAESRRVGVGSAPRPALFVVSARGRPPRPVCPRRRPGPTRASSRLVSSRSVYTRRPRHRDQRGVRRLSVPPAPVSAEY